MLYFIVFGITQAYVIFDAFYLVYRGFTSGQSVVQIVADRYK